MSGDSDYLPSQYRSRSRFVSVVWRIILPIAIVELTSRIGGYIADISSIDKGDAAEGLIRAKLLNIRYGFKARSIGRNVLFLGATRIHIGAGASLHHGVVIATGATGYCDIGARSHVSHLAVLASAGGISIGADCAVSSGVAIYSASQVRIPGRTLPDTPLNVAPVRLGDRVLVGANAMIMPGVEVDNDGVIGAGAVVLKNVAANQVVGGVPARELRRWG